jgi:peptidoglycan/LPS O-acetylase OafA/YrhL
LQSEQKTGNDERYALLRSGRRVPELDGLRGIAIGLVLVVHLFTAPAAFIARPNPVAYLQIATRLAWSGVDLFFILSGFLIGGILLDARNSKNFFGVFYFRRVCRILPIYLVFCAIVAVLQIFVYPSHPATMQWMFASPMPWHSYLTFTQNLWMAHRNIAGPAVLAPTWSLAVEEQFYLTLPLLIRYVRAATLPYILAAGIVAAPLIRLAMLTMLPQPQVGVYVLLPSRMDDLLLGVLAAYFLRKPEFWARFVTHRPIIWRVFYGLALGLPLMTLTSNAYSFPMASIGYDWLALFYLTALVLALTDPDSWLGYTLRRKWLMGLGIIAYNTYLFHTLSYGLLTAFLRDHGPEMTNLADLAVSLLSLGVTVGFAVTSWHFFEKPIVRLGHGAHYEPISAGAPLPKTPAPPNL